LSDVVIERLKLLAGVVSIAGALAVVASGGGWWAFWPGLLGLTLLAGPWRRRYWERVERNDPASVPLQVMWITTGWVLIAVVLGVTQLVGVWFRQSTGRGLGMFVAAFCFGVGWWKARAVRKRLLRTPSEE
jgi:hypothetical protein